RVANESGGQPLFFKRSEAWRIGQFMRELSGNSRQTLLWATATFDSRQRRFTVPVDSTIERVTFALSVGGEGVTLTIIRPSGLPVRNGDGDAEITELACARIVTVARPLAGAWQADDRRRTILVSSWSENRRLLVGRRIHGGGRPSWPRRPVPDCWTA